MSLDRLLPKINRHSLAQIAYIEKYALEKSLHSTLAPRQLLGMLSELAQHGSPAFHNLETYISDNFNQEYVLNTLHINRLVHKATSNAVRSDNRRLNDKVWRQLYDPQLAVYYHHPEANRQLIVIFTTSFNNFYISNAVFAELLASRGYSFLILKDPSSYQYTRGIPGLADTWEDLIDWLSKFLSEKRKCFEITFTGFSSSGYAAVLAASLLHPNRCIAFSLNSSMVHLSNLNRSKIMTPEMFDHIPPSAKFDLAEVKPSPNTEYYIYYGERSIVDKAHATRLRGSANIQIVEVGDVGHICFRPHLTSNRFVDIFDGK